MNNLKLILLSISTITTLNATSISGIGYADLGNEAKKEALADLSNKISVDVKSNFKTITKSIGKQFSKSNEKLVNITSNLPIIGAKFDTLIGNRLVKSTAVITSENSLTLYKIELTRLNKNITIVDEVPISEPFGSENLQIFSSTFSKNGSCPLKVPHCIENDDGYCVAGGTPSNVIITTRGLNMKKKKFKIEKAESSISWTSFEK